MSIYRIYAGADGESHIEPMVLVAYKPINAIVLTGLIVMGRDFLQAG